MSHESAELLLRGYHAFVAGDIQAIGAMLGPEVEWVPAGEADAIVISRERVLEVVAERAAGASPRGLAVPRAHLDGEEGGRRCL